MGTVLRKIKRNKEKIAQKKRKRESLKEIGISSSHFKRKMPKVDKRGLDFDVVDESKINKKGKKPSLVQQVIWLGYLNESTQELREEFRRMQEKQEEEKNLKKEQNLPTFKSI